MLLVFLKEPDTSCLQKSVAPPKVMAAKIGTNPTKIDDTK